MTRFLLLPIWANVLMTSLARISLRAVVRASEVARELSKGVCLTLLVGVLFRTQEVAGLVPLVWLVAMSRVDVNLAYPVAGLGFVVTMDLGWALLVETFSMARIAGTLLISVGVVVLASSR